MISPAQKLKDENENEPPHDLTHLHNTRLKETAVQGSSVVLRINICL